MVLLPFQILLLFDWILVTRNKLILPSQTGNIHNKFPRWVPHVVIQHALWRCEYGLILRDVNSDLQALFNCQMINIYQNRDMMHILISIETYENIYDNINSKKVCSTDYSFSLH
jgi:hypothetical protein